MIEAVLVCLLGGVLGIGLSLAVGLSVVQSLHPELQLKWPNDVWLRDRKLAGILIETTSIGDVRYAVIGIGINILPRDGDGMRTPPAALTEVLPQADAPSALMAVVPDLVRMMGEAYPNMAAQAQRLPPAVGGEGGGVGGRGGSGAWHVVGKSC